MALYKPELPSAEHSDPNDHIRNVATGHAGRLP
jgi:hypothetical protein